MRYKNLVYVPTADSNNAIRTQIFDNPAGSILNILDKPPCPAGSTLHKVPKHETIIRELTVTSEKTRFSLFF